MNSTSKKYDWESGKEYLNKSSEQIEYELELLRKNQQRVKKERKKVPYDPKLMAYFDSLHDQPERKLTYDQARIAFYDIWKGLIQTKKRKETGIENKVYISKEDAWIPQEFVKWMIEDESCELDLKKGILMMGTQGCGKSTLMKAGMIFSHRYLKHGFQFKRVNDIMFEIEEFKSITAVKPYFRDNWCFDDIGQMNEDVVVFSKYNIVEMLINRRIGSKYKTLATTNLNGSQIEGAYGKVVASRFNEMFNPVVFSTDQDCRKLE